MNKIYAVGLFVCLCAVWIKAHQNKEYQKYSNIRIAKISGDEEVAQRIARDLGDTYEGQFGQVKDYNELVRDNHPEMSLRDSSHLTERSMDEDDQGDLSKLGTFPTKPAPSSTLTYETTKSIGLFSKKTSAYASRYSDPYWEKQWYLQDYRTVNMPVMDHNVVPVHKLGYTGKGVTVAVVDDGIQGNNAEYTDNFLFDLSYDMCDNHQGSEPDSESPHGTSCAGVIAMKPNNALCGVGIAYNAKIVGIRAICERKQHESVTAKALAHHVDKIDIYSNSWGAPGGEGKYITVMDHMTVEALKKGASTGRNGKGNIYVKASGNDRYEDDNCAVDHEINNPFVIGISGADQQGKFTYYSEACTAVFAAAYTENLLMEGIVAPDLNGGCYTEFGGTSASAPVASAIIALALEANPDLTYRDVMHLITMSAEVAPLADNGDTWYKNGRGFWVSNDFGFGLMNAENMVTLAKNWKNVPDRRMCIDTFQIRPLEQITHGSSARIPLETTACQGTANEVNYLEHIEVVPTVDSKGLRRGDIMIYITSPAGTTSLLLPNRPNDSFPRGMNGGWSIMSTHNWGENPQGKWIIEFQPLSPPGQFAYVKEVTVRFFGTKPAPKHLTGNTKRTYAAFRLPNGKTNID